jgi:hypothetical protein
MTTLGVVPPSWVSELESWTNEPASDGAATSNAATMPTIPGSKSSSQFFSVCSRQGRRNPRRGRLAYRKYEEKPLTAELGFFIP